MDRIKDMQIEMLEPGQDLVLDRGTLDRRQVKPVEAPWAAAIESVRRACAAANEFQSTMDQVGRVVSEMGMTANEFQAQWNRSRDFNTDEAPGMTLAELLGEIDEVLA